MRRWFDGGTPLPLIKPGSVDERRKARIGAALLTVRNDGTTDDLRTLLDVLALWPQQDGHA